MKATDNRKASMTDVPLQEALAPWAVTIVAFVTLGGLVAGATGALTGFMLGPWVGMFLSFHYINLRFWGHPFRFGPQEGR